MYLFFSRRWGCREGEAQSEITVFLTMNIYIIVFMPEDNTFPEEKSTDLD